MDGGAVMRADLVLVDAQPGRSGWQGVACVCGCVSARSILSTAGSAARVWSVDACLACASVPRCRLSSVDVAPCDVCVRARPSVCRTNRCTDEIALLCGIRMSGGIRCPSDFSNGTMIRQRVRRFQSVSARNAFHNGDGATQGVRQGAPARLLHATARRCDGSYS